MVEVPALADTVDGEVRVGVGQGDDRLILPVLPGRRRSCHCQNIVLGNRSRQDDFSVDEKPAPSIRVPGGLFGHVEIHVELIRGSRNRAVLTATSWKNAEFIDPLLGQCDLAGIVPTAFHLAHFTPNDFVPGLGVCR